MYFWPFLVLKGYSNFSCYQLDFVAGQLTHHILTLKSLRTVPSSLLRTNIQWWPQLFRPLCSLRGARRPRDGWTASQVLYIRQVFSVHCTVHIEEELDRRDGKGRQCCLGDVYLKIPHCSDLAARMIWKKVFGRTSILGGWWFGGV